MRWVGRQSTAARCSPRSSRCSSASAPNTRAVGHSALSTAGAYRGSPYQREWARPNARAALVLGAAFIVVGHFEEQPLATCCGALAPCGCPGPPRGAHAPPAFSTVDRLCGARLCRRVCVGAFVCGRVCVWARLCVGRVCVCARLCVGHVCVWGARGASRPSTAAADRPTPGQGRRTAAAPATQRSRSPSASVRRTMSAPPPLAVPTPRNPYLGPKKHSLWRFPM